MAIVRDHPYTRFNFLVDLGGGGEGVDAGFAEVSGLSTHVEVIEYRNGNSKLQEPTKLTGLTRVSDVTLRRGLIGSLSLWQWFEQVRSGDPAAIRTVTIRLQDESRTADVVTWRLVRARPVRHLSGPLDAIASDVAIEELVIAHERLEIE